MPAVVNFDKMQVGRKGGGKHWTQDEVDRRRHAAEKTQRKKPSTLKPPAWIASDLQTMAVWQQVIKAAKGLEILDGLDANTLATYCKLEVEKQRAIESEDIVTFDKLAKTALLYAKNLGLTPEARARLAKRRAERDKGDPNADLFD